jgi:hypothetical protein
MPVAVVMDFEGGTPDQYDQIIELMGFRSGGPGAPGGLVHWATVTDAGLRVTDVWQDQQQFERFAEQQIGPFAKQAGIPAPPMITFYPVHNYLTAGS